MKIYVIAGEPSGDALGGALMDGLNSLVPDIQYSGVGGPLMQAQGLTSQFPMEELSLMGIAEVLPKYFHLKRRIRECAEAVIAQKPDVMITIDAPDFCLRVAKLVKAKAPHIRTVHYVAPSVWAWRPKRADKMAKCIDQVLALLPFEPPHMEAAGMECDFVGHPIATQEQATDAEADQFRLHYGIGEQPLLLVLPGSRRSEVTRLSPVFQEAVKGVLERVPDLQIVLPAAPAVAGLIKASKELWPERLIVLDPRELGDNADRLKKAAFRAADVALAASGTVSLELAAARTPMVIAYDMSWLSRKIISAMLRIDTVTLVSLVSDTRVIPELIGDQCKPELIAPYVAEVLNHPAEQIAAMTTTMHRLGEGGEAPGLRAAKAVLAGLHHT